MLFLLYSVERVKRSVRRSLPLFAVKPLLIIYMMSFAITESVGTQLWLFKTCTVNFNYSSKYSNDNLTGGLSENIKS